MYYGNTVVLLDPRTAGQSHRITRRATDPSVSGKSTRPHKTGAMQHTDRHSPACVGQGEPPYSLHAVPAKDPVLKPESEKYISNDDCTNLRIELEICADSKLFIDHL